MIKIILKTIIFTVYLHWALTYDEDDEKIRASRNECLNNLNRELNGTFDFYYQGTKTYNVCVSRISLEDEELKTGYYAGAYHYCRDIRTDNSSQIACYKADGTTHECTIDECKDEEQSNVVVSNFKLVTSSRFHDTDTTYLVDDIVNDDNKCVVIDNATKLTFLLIDLVYSYFVERVVIYRGTDLSVNVTDIDLYLGDTQDTSTLCYQYHGHMNYTINIFPCYGEGQYVRLRAALDSNIAACEISVFAAQNILDTPITVAIDTTPLSDADSKPQLLSDGLDETCVTTKENLIPAIYIVMENIVSINRIVLTFGGEIEQVVLVQLFVRAKFYDNFKECGYNGEPKQIKVVIFCKAEATEILLKPTVNKIVQMTICEISVYAENELKAGSIPTFIIVMWVFIGLIVFSFIVTIIVSVFRPIKN